MSRAKKQSRKRSNRLKKNAKRLAAYSAAAAATLITTQDRSAEAEEVVWDIPDITVGAADSGILFNMITGVTSTPALSYYNYTQGAFRVNDTDNGFAYIAGPAHVSGSSTTGFVDPGGFGTAFAYPTNLGAGVVVDGGQPFGAQTSFPSYGNLGYLSNFQSDAGGRGFVGLQFLIDGNLHYGWAEVSGLGSNNTVLHAFGYNDTPGEPSDTPDGGTPVTVIPNSVTPTEGDFVTGSIADLAESDNADYSMRRRSSDLQSRTEFEVKSISPTATPTRFDFMLEGSVFARGNVVQTIELFDYDAGNWELVDTSDSNRAPMPDKVVTATPAGDLSRFVEAGTMSIEARILYKSDRARQKFASNTDQAVWTIQ